MKAILYLLLSLLLCIQLIAQDEAPIFKVSQLLPNRPMEIASLGNDLLFFYPEYNGLQNGLYKLDPSNNSPILIKEVNGGGGNSPFVNMNGALYFSAISSNSKHYLYRTDGTTEGTYKLADASEESFKTNLVVLRNNLYYLSTSEKYDRIFATNGTSTRSVMLHDWASPGNLAVSNGLLYMSVRDEKRGYEPYKSNGTDADLLKDINTQPDTNGERPNRDSHSNPREFTPFGSLTCFVAMYYNGLEEGINNHTEELFVTNGTAEGTHRITDFKHANRALGLSIIATTNSKIYFTTRSGWTHVDLYVYNGQSLYTNEEGKAWINISTGNYSYSISHHGYQNYQAEINLLANYNLDITLVNTSMQTHDGYFETVIYPNPATSVLFLNN